MTQSANPLSLARMLNAVCAVALGVAVLVLYWPEVKLLDLHLADAGFRCTWIETGTCEVAQVTPSAAAERAGLRVGDRLEFDPDKNEDWVLAGYREMPEGFSATLPVRHADGSQFRAKLIPERVAYLPTLNDRLAFLARLLTVTVTTVFGVTLAVMRPGLMSWSLLLFMVSSGPALNPSRVYLLAFGAVQQLDYLPYALVYGMLIMQIPFALTFPRNQMMYWRWWQRVPLLLAGLAWLAYWSTQVTFVAFEHDRFSATLFASMSAVMVGSALAAVAIFWRSYRNAAPA